MAFCGLDFGTSNSTVGILRHGQPELVVLEGDKRLLRSAIFLDDEILAIHFGERAIEEYIDGAEGRLMTSIKSVLGSSLMEEKTNIFNELRPYSDVLGHFIGHMKEQAERQLGRSIDSVVLGRPVHFNDSDAEADQLAEETLYDIAAAQGFRHIEFQYEPIAAALAYEQTVQRQELALIVDMGGGTSDFTLIKIDPQNDDSETKILATAGVHIGGTDFDRLLSYHYLMPHLGLHTQMQAMNGSAIDVPSALYNDLCTWHKINTLYSRETRREVQNLLVQAYDKLRIRRLLTVLEQREGHRLLEKVELGKKQLSAQSVTELDLATLEAGLRIELTRPGFEGLIAPDLDRVRLLIQQLLRDAGVRPAEINAVFFTGGTTQIRRVKAEVMALFTQAKMIEGDIFGSVGTGLTLDAAQRFA